MTIEFKVNSLLGRGAAVLFAVALCAVLSVSALHNLIAGVLSDPRVDAPRDLLASGIAYVPNSAMVNARLAQAEMLQSERDLLTAERLARKAIDVSPFDFRHRLLMATVKEAQGDRDGAEQALEQALVLAPNYTDVHWRLANLLVREGKLAKSIGEFRIATTSNASLLPSALDLLWRVSAGNLAVLDSVTPTDPKSRSTLAQFLLKQSRVADAITIFSGIDRVSLAGLSESAGFIDALVSAGHWDEARGLWIGLVSGAYAQPGRPLPAIWNGSFETDIARNLGQFDWAIARNEYAVPTIDLNTSHSGSRSLRIDFTGRDTTKLDGQVKQNILLNPGTRYLLECFAKTEKLETPQGPRIVVVDAGSSAEIAASAPVAVGSSNWQRIAFEFTAPPGVRAAVLTIRRVPKYSYDNPTRGTVWFDDFALTEQTK